MQIFSKNKNKEEAKKMILKEYFNSGAQKKIITKAARESAKDQNNILNEYYRLVKP